MCANSEDAHVVCALAVHACSKLLLACRCAIAAIPVQSEGCLLFVFATLVVEEV